MKQRKPLEFKEVAEWSIDPKRIDRHTIATAFALNNIFNKGVRLTAKSQRAIFGFVPFGKATILVNNSGISAVKKCCFGTDFNEIIKTWPEVEAMVKSKRKPSW